MSVVTERPVHAPMPGSPKGADKVVYGLENVPPAITAAAVAAAAESLGKSMARKGSKGSMGPPADPVASHSPTPARMARLPSLQQISVKYHPSPLSEDSSAANMSIAAPTQGENTSPTRRKMSINPLASPTRASYSAASPSGRLKLPVSAMMRSQSSTGPASQPSIHSVRPNLEEGDTPQFTDPFLVGKASPGSAPMAVSQSSRSEVGPAPMSRNASFDGYNKGRKDMPSLELIRAHIGSHGSPTVSARGSIALDVEDDIPEVITPIDEIDARLGSITVPASTPRLNDAERVLVQAALHDIHRLRHAWALFYDSKTYRPDPELHVSTDGDVLSDWEKSLLTVGEFDTVEGFARHFNNIRQPSRLNRNSNYHLFKKGIRPMWEDPANANGGKWVILLRSVPHLLDLIWANLAMALIGDMLDPEDQICGIVASTRPKVDRIQIWTRAKDNVEAINRLGRRILEAMALEGREIESMSLEFQYNCSNSSPPPNTFFHIPFAPQVSRSSSFAHAPPTPSKLNPHTLSHHPSLTPLPYSPMSPRSPLASLTVPSPSMGGMGGMGGMGPLGGMGGMGMMGAMGSMGSMNSMGSMGSVSGSTNLPRRTSASNAFSGPMGMGGIKSGLVSPRRGSAQLP